jgi:hypothetical protein
MKLFRILAILTVTCTLAACETKSSIEPTSDTTSSDDVQIGDSAGSDAGVDAVANDTASDGGDISQDISQDTVQTPPIYGAYSSNYGGYEEITATMWDETTVVKFDADKRWAVTQNPASDKYNPSQFSKIVWTAPVGGSFYYCTVDYGLATADLAQATTKTFDDSAPDQKGCAGFAWTKLTGTAPIAIAGKYSDDYGDKPIISSRWWDSTWVQQFDNTQRWAIVQSPANDKYTPNKFSKNVWTAPVAGTFYYCTVDYGLDSADLALASTKTADDSAPDKSGCGGFSWTKLTPQ